jgi:hypothetical protein
LKQFQSWPREWQELCAEYWAECDYPLVLPSADQDQPKADQKLATRRRRDAYTPAEVERIQKMLLAGKPGTLIAQSMWELTKDHRTIKAWENRISIIKLEMRKRGEIK